jgi:hypothetical protein
VEPQPTRQGARERIATVDQRNGGVAMPLLLLQLETKLGLREERRQAGSNAVVKRSTRLAVDNAASLIP